MQAIVKGTSIRLRGEDGIVRPYPRGAVVEVEERTLRRFRFILAPYTPPEVVNALPLPARETSIREAIERHVASDGTTTGITDEELRHMSAALLIAHMNLHNEDIDKVLDFEERHQRRVTVIAAGNRLREALAEAAAESAARAAAEQEKTDAPPV